MDDIYVILLELEDFTATKVEMESCPDECDEDCGDESCPLEGSENFRILDESSSDIEELFESGMSFIVLDGETEWEKLIICENFTEQSRIIAELEDIKLKLQQLQIV